MRTSAGLAAACVLVTSPAFGQASIGPTGGSDLSRLFGVVARGTDGAPTCPIGWSTLETGFESLAVLPANLVNQLDTVMWGGAAAGCVTGRGHFSAVTAGLAPSEYGAVTDAVGGNATTKLRGFVETGRGQGQGFRWARYNFLRTNTASPTQAGAERFAFGPALGQNLRVGHDTYLTATSSGWTSTVWDASGGVVGALNMAGYFFGNPWPYLWTDCAQDSPRVGCTVETPGFYRSGAPYPGGAGQNVPAPIGQWFRVTFETTADFRLLYVVDFLDGNGEFVVYDWGGCITGPFGCSRRVDQVAWYGAFESAGDAMYVDNLRAEGVRACRNCAGDATGDCVSDFGDLNLVLSNFGRTVEPVGITGDLNGDGLVDFADLNLVLSNFGNGC